MSRRFFPLSVVQPPAGTYLLKPWYTTSHDLLIRAALPASAERGLGRQPALILHHERKLAEVLESRHRKHLRAGAGRDRRRAASILVDLQHVWRLIFAAALVDRHDHVRVIECVSRRLWTPPGARRVGRVRNARRVKGAPPASRSPRSQLGVGDVRRRDSKPLQLLLRRVREAPRVV